MNAGGTVLVLLTIIFVSCQIVAHRWIKKVTNCYFFWLAVGTFCFVWLMVFRFAGQFSTYWGHGTFSDPGSFGQSMTISSGLLLDICPLCGFLMPILCMVDPSRKAAKTLAPISVIAGAITIFSFLFDTSLHNCLSARFIFMGSDDNGGPCYFIMHFFQIVLAVGIMLNSPRYGWKGLVASLCTSLLLYTYVAIAKTISGAKWYVSGLDYNDWTSEGEYHFVAEILHWNPKVCPYIGIPFLNLLGCGAVTLRDYVFDKRHFKYGNARNNKIVSFHIGKKHISMKQWWMWYNYDKFVLQKYI